MIVMLALIVFGVVYFQGTNRSKLSKLGGELPVYASSSSSLLGTATTTSVTQLAAARSQVSYRALTNKGGAGEGVHILCMSTSTGVATTTAGYFLTPSSTWEMSDDKGNLCRNALQFYSDNGTPTIELYQIP